MSGCRLDTIAVCDFRRQGVVRTDVATGFNRFHGQFADRFKSTPHGAQKSEISVAEVEVRTPERSSALSGNYYLNGFQTTFNFNVILRFNSLINRCNITLAK